MSLTFPALTGSSLPLVPPEKPWRRESCSIISSLRQSEQRTSHLNPIRSGSRLVLLQVGAEEMGGIQE